MRLVLCVCSILVLAGCSLGLGSSADRSFYTLELPACLQPKIPTLQKTGVIVDEVSAGPFVNSQKIIFRKNGMERGFYQFAQWIEPPPKRLTSLIVKALECNGAAGLVTRSNSAGNADFVLQTELIDMYQDLSSSPMNVVVEMRAELISLKLHSSVAQRLFVKHIIVPQEDATGAVTAFNLATVELLSELSDWVSQAVSGK